MLTVASLEASGFTTDVDPSRLRELAAAPGVVVWADRAEPSADEVQLVATQFDLHPLALEDALESSQRPKLETYPAHTFVVTYAYVGAFGDLAEVDVFLGHDWIITVRNANEAGQRYDPARYAARLARATNGGGGAEPSVAFALHALLDDVVDGWLDATEALDDQVDALEDEIFLDDRHDEEQLQRDILQRRRELLLFRRRVLPMRDVLLSVTRHEIPWLGSTYQKHFEDVLDHILRIIDLVDLQRELLGNTLDAHLALQSNRMNQVMKTMTAGGSIVLGATLIAGIYGMNFDTMPELHWAWGYPVALGTMAVLTLLLVVYFKRRRWI